MIWLPALKKSHDNKRGNAITIGLQISDGLVPLLLRQISMGPGYSTNT
ncbi:hypothetical protein KKF84_03555 [Myxococcota bacterium]|nr:hypothetical protein [Myxococcota bacterium]